MAVVRSRRRARLSLTLLSLTHPAVNVVITETWLTFVDRVECREEPAHGTCLRCHKTEGLTA
jgi:hypothetical protein